MGIDFDCADDKIERIEAAIDCAVMMGLQSFPSNERQISPLVYTCSCFLLLLLLFLCVSQLFSSSSRNKLVVAKE